MTSEKPSPRRSNRLLIVLGIGITLAMLAIGAIVIEAGRREALRQAETNDDNLTLTLRTDISRNLAMLSLSLQGAIEALGEPGINAVSPGIFKHAVFDRSASAEVASMLVLDTAGNVVHASVDGPVALNLADRDYFQVHRDRPDAGTFVSRTFRSRLRNGDLSFSLSRRLETKDGKFAGVVVGTISLEFLNKLFGSIQLGSNGAITLFTTSGRILFRTPFRDDDLNRDISGSDSFSTAMKLGQGHHVAYSPIDGVDRINTFATIDGFPLFVAVSTSTADLNSRWIPRAIALSAVLLVLCVSTLTLTFLFSREIGRRADAEAKLVQAAESLAQIAATDGLTGLGNRRTMVSTLKQEWDRASQLRRSIGLLMVDVDYFKLYNDRYGHPAGDEVLRQVADSLKASLLRVTDSACRYGGEEFIVLLPGITQDGAMMTAERIRAAIAELQIPHEGSAHEIVSLSIGVGVIRPLPGQDEATLLKMADLALYEAKRAGRNCVRSAATPQSRPESSTGMRSIAAIMPS